MEEKLLALGKWAGAVVTVGGVLVLSALCLRPLLIVSLPFLIAWGLAFLVRPLAAAICRHSVVNCKVISVALTVGAFLLIGGGVFWIVNRLWHEASALLANLSENPELIGGITERIDEWLSRFPLADGTLPLDVGTLLSDVLKGAVAYFSRMIGNFLLRVPSMLLFAVITIIASVYFALDLGGINRALRSLLPERMRRAVDRIGEALLHGAAVYLRSYTVLFFITLGLTLVGLLLLGVRYALLVAFLIAAVDLLPILGVGSVLCPWACVSFLLGRTALGIGLLALWLLVTVVRQTVEPRLLGGRLGLHPLLTLFAMYAGLKLFGIMGMLLAPIAAASVKSLLPSPKSSTQSPLDAEQKIPPSQSK